MSMRRGQVMTASLTSHQRNLCMPTRPGVISEEAPSAAAGISVRSVRWIECNYLQLLANHPRGRTRPDPLAGMCCEALVPLLQRSPALSPIMLLEHLQHQKPYVDWIRKLADQASIGSIPLAVFGLHVIAYNLIRLGNLLRPAAMVAA